METNQATMETTQAPVKADLANEYPERYVSEDLRREVERFLFREARLMDTEQFREWHQQMLDPDIRYVVTSTQLRSRRERRYAQPDKVFIYDDDHRQLGIRVNQYYDPQHWRIDPPEKYCHTVTNIEAFESDREDQINVRSNCLIVRARRSYEVDQFFYTREDVVRRSSAGTLRLLSRVIDYPERCVQGRNMLIFL
ncbi:MULTISPECIES: aromatic-ring-hydroxylating dioxygenase subunit beta [Paraburkholderia]|uniref:Dioxygenase beta subunit PhnAd n=2 Tax=Burkholderiaceae TaxID=119060 RepID=Q9ZHH2_9BURK|nr:aromatic-ring-hydroxylating dioxygenase subunit beta [Paraburkholderia aspalathi]AAD09873.1 dioxygenase beta subunit PhnAd [Paraburkholderia sartisoli]ACT53264.1 dioxygenase beta subunit [Burkholderia sp. C3]OWJ56147.1 hypothetical protein BWU74_31860 [Burkholderia sp. Bk]CAE6847923.1 2,4-dinitrotoluene dioxygenase system, small oxygenase component [Paraburkholderia aspalathi]